MFQLKREQTKRNSQTEKKKMENKTRVVLNLTLEQAEYLCSWIDNMQESTGVIPTDLIRDQVQNIRNRLAKTINKRHQEFGHELTEAMEVTLPDGKQNKDMV